MLMVFEIVRRSDHRLDERVIRAYQGEGRDLVLDEAPSIIITLVAV